MEETEYIYDSRENAFFLSIDIKILIHLHSSRSILKLIYNVFKSY